MEERSRSFIPHVVEPSFGVDRIVYALLEYAYREKQDRIVLEIPREVAAVEIGVFPLVNRDGLPETARGIVDALANEDFVVNYDESGSIGRRYARADEVGTPICITTDYQTLGDQTVTLRDLYSGAQVRTSIDSLPSRLRDYLKGRLQFAQLGTPVTKTA